jgi:ribonuclease BN (tRNA processing enzyme)
MKYPASRIRYIFVTHLHLDDYATLVNDRAFTTREPLNVFGPRGPERQASIHGEGYRAGEQNESEKTHADTHLPGD